MVNYTLDAPAKGYAALDPNHTHHFLVDDGFFLFFYFFFDVSTNFASCRGVDLRLH